MDRPIVFISYSHDSDEHKQRVLALSQRLRADGIETRLDQYLPSTPTEGWPRWMLNQLDEARFVLVICTETYHRRFRGKEEPGKGKGVDWEGALITQELYDARLNTAKFVPVLFSSDQAGFIPEPLRGRTFYQPTTNASYDELYDSLLGQAGVEPCEIGELKLKPRRKAEPLGFDHKPGQSGSARRELELAYLNELDVENLPELYTAMRSRSEQQYRHYGNRMKVELLPLGKDGALQPEKQEFPDAVEAILSVKRAALLGEPGGGKTTAIWKLAMEMAETARRNSQEPIPLLVQLREWTLADQSLPEFIGLQMDARKEGFGAYLNALLSEKRAALLLDGLNELPVDQRQNKYGQVCRFIQSVSRQHPNLIAVVSCRKEDYPPELGFDCINISPLDPIRIRQFAENYLQQSELADTLFWNLAGPEAQQLYKQFLKQLGDKLPEAEQIFWLKPQLPDGIRWGWGETDNWYWEKWVRLRDQPSGLMALASNPFMLNMLVGTFKAGGVLPQNRGDLFRNFVQIRLDRELTGERILATEMTPLTDAMARLAFEMQSRRATSNDEDSSGALTVLPKDEVVSLFGENAPRLLYLASSAGILNTDHPVRFTHQLLQEYFAAQHMDIRFRAGDWKATEIWPPAEWWTRTNWEVAAVLFVGLYNNDCTKAVEWVAEANPEVAAQCIMRSGVENTLAEEARKRLRKQWIDRLSDLKRETLEARAAVGRALGLTGWDNRKGVGVVERNGVKLPDFDWVEIPGGEFLYGDESENTAKPQKLTLPTFHISRYPVTYAQFQAFLDDPEGIAQPQWFEGLKAGEDERQMREQYFKFANHPRETVNWYQAMAFCRWMSWRLGTTYDLKKVSDWAVRLPTEFEWEKAARGTDGRIYPYGNEFDAARGNTDEGENRIEQTSAVGIFPNGASPYGVMEMSGNVWEWCLSNYDKPQLEARKENLRNENARVLRGGSWSYDRGSARAVCRDYSHPAGRINNVGFRVVCCRPPSS